MSSIVQFQLFPQIQGFIKQKPSTSPGWPATSCGFGQSWSGSRPGCLNFEHRLDRVICFGWPVWNLDQVWVQYENTCFSGCWEQPPKRVMILIRTILSRSMMRLKELCLGVVRILISKCAHWREILWIWFKPSPIGTECLCAKNGAATAQNPTSNGKSEALHSSGRG